MKMLSLFLIHTLGVVCLKSATQHLFSNQTLLQLSVGFLKSHTHNILYNVALSLKCVPCCELRRISFRLYFSNVYLSGRRKSQLAVRWRICIISAGALEDVCRKSACANFHFSHSDPRTPLSEFPSCRLNITMLNELQSETPNTKTCI